MESSREGPPRGDKAVGHVINIDFYILVCKDIFIIISEVPSSSSQSCGVQCFSYCCCRISLAKLVTENNCFVRPMGLVSGVGTGRGLGCPYSMTSGASAGFLKYQAGWVARKTGSFFTRVSGVRPGMARSLGSACWYPGATRVAWGLSVACAFRSMAAVFPESASLEEASGKPGFQQC